MAQPASTIQSQQSLYSIAPCADWVKRAEIAAVAAVERQDSPLHFLLVSFQDRVKDTKIERYQRRVYQVNDASQIESNSHSLHELSPKSEYIEFNRCVIYRDGKTRDCLALDRIRSMHRDRGLESQVISDNITIELLIDDLRVGDIVDIETTETQEAGEHALHGRFYHSISWLSWGVHIKEQECRYINESSKSLSIQQLDTDNNINKIWTVEPGSSYTHTSSDLQPEQSADFLPYWYWSACLRVTTKQRWEDISAHLYAKNKEHNVLNGVLDAELIEDIPNINWSDKSVETITAIVRFVQDDIRYRSESNGIYTHTPKSVAQTLSRRTGDCKDKSALLAVLLARIDVKANLVLVHTGLRDVIGVIQPTPYAFNHMIVQFDFNGRIYTVDPTMKKQGGDINSHARLNYGLCLPLTESGSDLNTIEYEATPLLINTCREFDLRFDTLDQCTLTVRRTYYHELADSIRFSIASSEKSNTQEHFMELASEFASLKLDPITSFTITEDDIEKNSLTTYEQYRFKGDTEQIKDGLLRFTSSVHNDFLMPARDTHPTTTEPTGHAEHTVKIHYSKVPDKVDDLFSEENEFFKYFDSMKIENSTLVCASKFTGLQSTLQAKDIAKCRELIAKVSQRSQTSVPFKLKKAKKKAGIVDYAWGAAPLLALSAVHMLKQLSLLNNPVTIILLGVTLTALITIFVKDRWRADYI